MDNDKYYNDDLGTVPRLSQSIANVILNKSPYHAWREHPKLGGKPRKPTDEMRDGTIIDALVINDMSDFVIIDADDYRTKKAQQERDEANANGKTPVLICRLDEYRTAAETIVSQCERLGYPVRSYESQKVNLWTEELGGGKQVHCKGKLDFWSEFELLIIDLKTTGDATVRSCIKSICNWGYDVQAAAYIRSIETRFPEYAGRVRFVNLFAELEDPYLVTPIEMDESFLTVGRMRWERACRKWHKCLSENKWPGYAEKTVSVQAPAWYVANEMQASADHYMEVGV